MIAAGFKWSKVPSEGFVDVVIVGRGDRAHVDALVKAAPEDLRSMIIEYFKPFAESQVPVRQGEYRWEGNRERADLICVWWKPVNEVLP